MPSHLPRPERKHGEKRVCPFPQWAASLQCNVIFPKALKCVRAPAELPC